MIRTTCFHDCWDACAMLATVKEGRVTELAGDPDAPYTRGFLCGKMRRYLDRQYASERLYHPLRNHNGTFKGIGWNEAYDLCAEKLSAVLDAHGPLSLFYDLGSGNMGMLRMLGLRFFNLLGGATLTSGNLCDAAGEQGQHESMGACLTHDPRDVLNSRSVIVWGRNPAVTHVHFHALVAEARRNGTHLTVIDPLPSATAAAAHLWLRPRPGTDIYLAMAMARLLLDEGIEDSRFLENHTEHFDGYRAFLDTHDPAELARRCDVPLDRIRRAAETYGSGRPASIWTGMGVQHYRWGTDTQRCISALGALTGNLGVSGGGVSLSHSSAAGFSDHVWRLDAAHRAVPKAVFGPALERLPDPPIRVAWFQGTNVVNQSQDPTASLRALSRIPFKVCLEIFMTDTAQACDVILPVSTFLERTDVRASYGDRTVGYMPKLVEPAGECRSDLEIYQALAQRMGIAEPMRGDAEHWIRELLRTFAPHSISLEHIREAGQIHSPLLPRVPFTGGAFQTPSGRFRFPDCPRLPGTDFGLGENEFHLVSPKAKGYQNSQVQPGAYKGPPKALLHPEAVPGLAEGSEAELCCELGRMRVRIAFDEQMRTDTIWVDQGGPFLEGGSVNALVPAVLSWDGSGACFYEARVRVTPVPPHP